MRGALYESARYHTGRNWGSSNVRIGRGKEDHDIDAGLDDLSLRTSKHCLLL
jgi:hypothetical protein